MFATGRQTSLSFHGEACRSNRLAHSLARFTGTKPQILSIAPNLRPSRTLPTVSRGTIRVLTGTGSYRSEYLLSSVGESNAAATFQFLSHQFIHQVCWGMCKPHHIHRAYMINTTNIHCNDCIIHAVYIMIQWVFILYEYKTERICITYNIYANQLRLGSRHHLVEHYDDEK